MVARDGDIILTEEQFIFYVFGYDHPTDKLTAYLKYIPKMRAVDFDLPWIDFEWNLGETRFLRPKQLYSPQIFKQIRKVFAAKYPEYLYRDPYLGKTVFVVPKEKILRKFIPKEQLQELLEKPNPVGLEAEALELLKMLEQRSGVSLDDFGLHGSLSTGMSTANSDIDLAVYGAEQFQQVKKTVFELFKDKKIQYLNEILSDEYRMNKCEYKRRKFVFNAIRREEEIQNSYGKFKYSPVRPLHFFSDVVKSEERMFRPAIYNIEDYFAAEDRSILAKTHRPIQVVSMVGEFRDIARKGDEVEVQGMLEKVTEVNGEGFYYRVVIGSGKGKEFMWPV